MAQYIGYTTISNEFGPTRLTDVELVKRDLLNHFAIRKGEKLLNPEFGSSIVDLVMEPLTPEVKNLILDEVNAVINNDPRVSPQNILVDEFENGIMVEMSLLFISANLAERLRIAFNRQDGTVLETE